MANDQNSKTYDLEERTYKFAKSVAQLVKRLANELINIEYAKQLIRSSSSVGANYIEANESLGKKDFLMRIRICRKEAKESAFWIKLLNTTNTIESNNIKHLFQEAIELKKIFSAIIEKSKKI